MKLKLLFFYCLFWISTIGFSQTNPLPGFSSTAGYINKLEVIATTNIDRFIRFRYGGNVPQGFSGIQYSVHDAYSWFNYSDGNGRLTFSYKDGNPTIKGDLGTSQFVLTRFGNIGFGTNEPSNVQGWGKVLEIKHSAHSKLLVSAETNDVKVGIFAHSNWNGARGVIGTESAHDLSFHTGYSQEQIRVKTNGNVGIGTSNPGHKLEVNGGIKTREVNVTTTGWPDFVFAPEYDLMPLDSLNDYIQSNRHLPEVPSEKEVLENGVNVGEMNVLLLKKIEELTLYLIEQKKETEELRKEIKQLKNAINLKNSLQD
ncbi:hypothetical protein SAMN00777080_3553 [Aquiflexum balticum DSM 16537]|uniref:Uncharacterized protein n=1 Tax=Aquiflexum balticum DSM 16537 TaxID=758820 RepID=A0A1W2H8K2_9BACT|nr:hypothetical protein [Aquiflexum balticum]SMD44916.1 hypothetical protein SAMN00777080_3553 [Aquiflexum balticum DSM 16537]